MKRVVLAIQMALHLEVQKLKWQCDIHYDIIIGQVVAGIIFLQNQNLVGSKL